MARVQTGRSRTRPEESQLRPKTLMWQIHKRSEQGDQDRPDVPGGAGSRAGLWPTEPRGRLVGEDGTLKKVEEDQRKLRRKPGNTNQN